MILDHPTRAPLAHDPAGIAWVRQIMDSLSLPDKVAQVFVLISMGDDPAAM